MFDTVSFVRGGHSSPACQMGFCARHWRWLFFLLHWWYCMLLE